MESGVWDAPKATMENITIKINPTTVDAKMFSFILLSKINYQTGGLRYFYS
jgi:hypothetical protein